MIADDGAPGPVGRTSSGEHVEPRRVELIVQGSYFPQVVGLEAGVPTLLGIYRAGGSWCSESFCIPALGIEVDLPCFERTEVVLPALVPGRYAFTCDMEMLHGALAVTARPPSR